MKFTPPPPLTANGQTAIERLFATFQGDGVETTFNLPVTAKTDFGVMAFTLQGEVMGLVSPSDFAALVALTDDLTPGATITASASTTGAPADVADDSVETHWEGNYAWTGQWLRIDFGAGNPQAVIAARFWPFGTEGGGRVINEHDWQFSDNGTAFTTAASGTNNQASAFTPIKRWSSVGAHRYWRLFVTSIRNINGSAQPSFGGVAELELFAADPDGGIGGVTFASPPAAGDVVIEYIPR